MRDADARPRARWSICARSSASTSAGLRAGHHRRLQRAAGSRRGRAGSAPVARAERPPAIARPLAVEREVDAEVGLGVRLRPARHVREPRAGHEHAGRGDPALLQGLEGGAVHRPRHAEVVGVEDQEPRARRMAEPLLHASAVRRRCRRRREQRQDERRSPSASATSCSSLAPSFRDPRLAEPQPDLLARLGGRHQQAAAERARPCPARRPRSRAARARSAPRPCAPRPPAARPGP